jgi:peptide/nickel transport system substrate-binding protein
MTRLGIFGITIIGSLVAGAVSAQPYEEAPALAGLVAAGQLPPVEDRLPSNPLVVETEGGIGTYGGTIRRGTASLFFAPVFLNMTREPLVEFSYPFPAENAPSPNLAETIEWSEDARTMTLTLREGLKWSDGEPFTSADVMFMWHDVFLNENSAVQLPAALFVEAGVAPELTAPDDYTLVFAFDRPFQYYETALASVWDQFALPEHYMAQFHPDRVEGATWEAFNDQLNWWNGRGRVTLTAWMLDEVDEAGGRVTAVRNPYYWKVDAEGNQLPYIDRVEAVLVEDRQSVAVGNVTGDFDFDGLWVGNQHLPMFVEARDAGDIRLAWAVDNPNMAFHFNYDAADAQYRELLRNADFRRAFSMGIDREEINRLYYFDLMTPGNAGFSPAGAYGDRDMAGRYATHDPEAANALLDEAGYTDRDGDGWRDFEDGSRIRVVVDVANHDLYAPIVEYMVDTFDEIGLELVMNNMAQDLLINRRLTPDWHVSVWDLTGSNEPLSQLSAWAAIGEGLPFWHPQGHADPFSDDYARFTELLVGARAVPFEERVAMLREANELLVENVFVAHLGYYRRVAAVGSHMGNVPEEVVRDFTYGLFEAAIRPYQIYVRSE